MKTKTLPTGIVTTQRKVGNKIVIDVNTKKVKSQTSKMNLVAKILVGFLFCLAVTGISGFSIVWIKQVLSTHPTSGFILVPFVCGINYLNFIIAIHGYKILKNEFKR